MVKTDVVKVVTDSVTDIAGDSAKIAGMGNTMKDGLNDLVTNMAQGDIQGATAASVDKLGLLLQQLIELGVSLGKKVLMAVVIYLVGRYIVRFLKRVVNGFLDRRNVVPEVKTFVGSIVSVSLNLILIISVVGALGIETTSFAALLASAGVAIGMAMSGQMQNLAGGVLILLQKPYKIGDYIETNGIQGSVESIQIFTTKLKTVDNKVITVPNGAISGSVLTNYSDQPLRRVDFSFGVEYGQDFELAKRVLMQVIDADEHILKDPAPFVELGELADSSVNITVRVWCNGADYWTVFFDMNRKVYETFNKEGIGFPFPQITVHQAND
ncbi:MAG: mechanosensitive ion channel [Paludibacteraceae bacterium]|nr:mechanosensitive ion channel [Paludibacteraceae bacterium]